MHIESFHLTEPQPITEHLVDEIRQRAEHGRAKYGQTLDRTDLSIAEWLQHAKEEALDFAGYCEAARRIAQQGVHDEHEFDVVWNRGWDAAMRSTCRQRLLLAAAAFTAGLCSLPLALTLYSMLLGT